MSTHIPFLEIASLMREALQGKSRNIRISDNLGGGSMTHTIHLHPRTAVRILHAAVFLLLCCFLSESRAQTGPLPVCDWFRFSRIFRRDNPTCTAIPSAGQR